MKKNILVIIVLVGLVLVSAFFIGNKYFEGKNDYTDDSNKGEVNNEHDEQQSNDSNQQLEIDVASEARKIFDNKMSDTQYVVSYTLNDYELCDSAGNIYVYEFNYDFTYNDDYFGTDRADDTDTIKNKVMYYAFKKVNNELELIETGTGGYGNYAKNYLAKQAFIDYLKGLQDIKVTDYVIKTVQYEKTNNNELMFYVVFSVQSDPIMDAGNGTISANNWVEDKELYVNMKESNEQYTVINISTSKPLD